MPERGLRKVESAEAAIVPRIFQEYASGRSAKAIAQTLNREAIIGPHSGTWGPSTIAGNAARGSGGLNNQLYVGRLIWNRLRYIKDPSTGGRVSRLNDPQQRVVVEVPTLRIIDDEQRQAVKTRRAKLTSKSEGSAKAAFWDQRRARYLFSGLMRCAVCGGGGFAKISLHHFGCSTARNKGTCANLRTIRRDVLETTVLDALRHRLMDPELYARALSLEVQQDLLPSASRGTRAARGGLLVKFQRLLPAEFRRSPRFTIDRALAKEQRFRGIRSIWGMSVQPRARHRMPQAGGLR